MNRAGAVELLMPAVQPAELWQESGRWEQYGPELLRLKDRHQRDFVIGPTHEEVITDAVRRDVKSYRQLPIHLYQIQMKFRDEIRPRFGVMRGREFPDEGRLLVPCLVRGLAARIPNMYETYSRIFTRLGLKFRAVAADTGSIGGTGSHEFHVLATRAKTPSPIAGLGLRRQRRTGRGLAPNTARPGRDTADGKGADARKTRCEMSPSSSTSR